MANENDGRMKKEREEEKGRKEEKKEHCIIRDIKDYIRIMSVPLKRKCLESLNTLATVNTPETWNRGASVSISAYVGIFWLSSVKRLL